MEHSEDAIRYQEFKDDRKAKWEEAIRSAKSMIVTRKTNQMQIAKLAHSVCEITRGGAHVRSLYTIKRFAKEIGISPRTLSHWLYVYIGVYLKSPPALREKASYSQMDSVGRRVTSGATDKQIRDLLSQEMKRPDLDALMCKYMADLRTICYHLEKGALNKLDKDVAEELNFWLSKAKNNYRGRKIAAVNHGLITKIGRRTIGTVGQAMRGDINIVGDEYGTVKINDNDRRVYKLLAALKEKDSNKCKIGPTEIGKRLTSLSESSCSAWALRSLVKLQSLDLVKRNDDGMYHLIKEV